MLHLSGLAPVAQGMGHSFGQSHLLVDPFEQQHAAVGGLIRGGERHRHRLVEQLLEQHTLSRVHTHVGFPYKNRPALPVQAISRNGRASQGQIHE